MQALIQFNSYTGMAGLWIDNYTKVRDTFVDIVCQMILLALLIHRLLLTYASNNLSNYDTAILKGRLKNIYCDWTSCQWVRLRLVPSTQFQERWLMARSYQLRS